MSLIRKVLMVLWRIWFYVLMAIPIVFLLPFLLIAISREKWYPYFFIMARIWGRFILFGMGWYLRIKKDYQPVPNKSYMIVANHTSMADIMLMLSIIPNPNPFVFVGKKELANIPLFGFLYKRTCILVDRSSSKSRMAVFERAQSRIHQGLSICIFPEGGVPEDETILLDRFKDGAFRLAIEHDLPVLPIVFPDNKKRFPFTFFNGGLGVMRARILEPIETTSYSDQNKADIQELREHTWSIIHQALLESKT